MDSGSCSLCVAIYHPPVDVSTLPSAWIIFIFVFPSSVSTHHPPTPVSKTPTRLAPSAPPYSTCPSHLYTQYLPSPLSALRVGLKPQRFLHPTSTDAARLAAFLQQVVLWIILQHFPPLASGKLFLYWHAEEEWFLCRFISSGCNLSIGLKQKGLFFLLKVLASVSLVSPLGRLLFTEWRNVPEHLFLILFLVLFGIGIWQIVKSLDWRDPIQTPPRWLTK